MQGISTNTRVDGDGFPEKQFLAQFWLRGISVAKIDHNEYKYESESKQESILGGFYFTFMCVATARHEKQWPPWTRGGFMQS